MPCWRVRVSGSLSLSLLLSLPRLMHMHFPEDMDALHAVPELAR